MSDLLLRLLLAIGLALAGIGLFRLVNRRLLSRNGQKPLGLEKFETGRPGVLYFTMEGCLPCKTTQRPALNALREMSGGQVQVIEVDAAERPGLASHWGVLSVPTTFIIDPEGQPRRVNHGVVREHKLRQQIEETSGTTWFSEMDSQQEVAQVPVTGLD